MKHISLFIIFVIVCVNAFPQEIVRLYDGIAPGSESWNWEEYESLGIIHNVVIPTMTIYRPIQERTTGAALLICPGGGFTGLWIIHEGYSVKDWCLRHGITAIILKYRIAHTNPMDPQEASKNSEIRKIAADDGRKAIELLRKNAVKYGIDPNKIGIIGFSAGAILAFDVAMNHSEFNKPNLVAPIYGFADKGIIAPKDAAPMFICSPEFDIDNKNGNEESTCLNMYEAWRFAKVPCDLHIFNDASHGFGMRASYRSCDIWPDNLLYFMRSIKFIP